MSFPAHDSRRARNRLAAGLLALGLLAPSARAFEVQGTVRAGVEDVQLERFRRGFDAFGELTHQRHRTRDLLTRYSGSLLAVQETDLGTEWILDTELRLDFDVFSELQVSSERFDRASALGRVTAARSLPGEAFLSLEATGRRYLEQFLPDLEATLTGLKATYEKEIRGDAYLQGRLGIRRGVLHNRPEDSFDELKAEVIYQHLPPDRFRREVLPFHPWKPAHSSWELLYGHALELDRARHILRYQADATLLADLAPDPPLPRAWRDGLVVPHFGVRESAMTLGLEGIQRRLDGGNSFFRGTGFAGIQWSLTDFLSLALRDALSLQDWKSRDPDRLRSDRLQNHFAADLVYSKETAYVSLTLGLDSHLFEDLERFDYNRPHVGIYGSTDRGKYRLSGYVRAGKEIHLDPGVDLPDLTRYDSFAGVEYRFTRDRTLEASLRRERVNITGPQTEIDSAYLEEGWRVAYRQRVGGSVFAEGGYRHEDESHEFFTENDRTDRSAYLALEAAF